MYLGTGSNMSPATVQTDWGLPVALTVGGLSVTADDDKHQHISGYIYGYRQTLYTLDLPKSYSTA